MIVRVLDELRVDPGERAHLGSRDPKSTPHAPGDREHTEAASDPVLERLSLLQDRLYAEHRRSVLIVLQGVDCSGKDGTIRHVIRGLSPSGTGVADFKVPTAEELAHDFLWRIHTACPRSGHIAVFNRSHYEDVTTVRVQGLVRERVWQARFDHINAFERILGHSSTRVLKFFLHISADEQARRLRERAADPDKRWKLTESDLAGHAKFAEYAAAWDDAISQTSTAGSPWWVIPADHKWYRNWAVAKIIEHTLDEMDPRFPDLAPLAGIDDL